MAGKMDFRFLAQWMRHGRGPRARALVLAAAAAAIGAACGPAHYETTVNSKPSAKGIAPDSGAPASSAAPAPATESVGHLQGPKIDPIQTRIDAAGKPPPGAQATAAPAPKPSSPGKQEIRRPICEDQHDAEKMRQVRLQHTASSFVCAECTKGSFQKDLDRNNKIDILFIVDTSPSLASTRTAIANNLAKFLLELPKNASYRIAVMPAHSDETRWQTATGPVKSSGLGGQLLKFANGAFVLSSEGLDPKFGMQELTELIKKRIDKDMLTDAATDGGEAGLLSLSLGITTHLKENQNLGFFRPDATLAVVFVSDENDICAETVYPDSSPHRQRSLIARTRTPSFASIQMAAPTASTWRRWRMRRIASNTRIPLAGTIPP